MDKWQTFEKRFNTNGIVDALEWWKKVMEEEQKTPVLGNEADQAEAMEKAGVVFSSEKIRGVVL